ncbi:SRPBCC domain-containing protein [Streptomyces sp. NBC_01571]|uniref:SRPBCC family protein n=1 Tax=Streptomyces sp. NBC_01571 TaxID=2975883 RepID=UPI0022553834|nr:SRPBCC domain-containing protein [Streptomyces sp. NBC_01571]MCX4576427.1 SRPBCC domain-containing protein [Streptomyces sp. NBC_01571]
MEHEVFVPVPAERLREALADPARVARAVPGLQQDAGTAPVSGRLRVRVGGHTITYRGAVRVVARDDGAYAVEGDGTEARGTGTVKLALTLRLAPAEGGTTLVVTGTATADGRLAEIAPATVATAAIRLLNRFAQNLAAGTADASAAEGGSGAVGEAGGASGSEGEAEGASGSEGEPGGASGSEAEGEGGSEGGGESEGVGDATDSVPDAEVPPPSLDPLAGDGQEPAPTPPGPVDREDSIAEAAHARRTMIGRSAEEVDHAPPRGRYAPVPAPEVDAARATLRWAAPAAAVVVASAIVVTRALRKRR